MPRSNLVNAVDTALADPVSGADATIRVTDPTYLPPVPFYLVIDPFNTTLGREYLLANAINGDVLTVTRNLAGTDSTSHDQGDLVRITYMAQHLDDLWDEAESHLPLAGGVMQGDLSMGLNFLYGLPAPVNPDDAVPKFYVDSQDHHTRYSDDEARSAVTGIYLPLSGGTMSGDIDMGGSDIVGIDTAYPDPNADAFLGFSTLPWKRGYIQELWSTDNVRKVTIGETQVGFDVPLWFPGATVTGNVAMGGNEITDIGLAYPVAGSSAFLGFSTLPWERGYINKLFESVTATQRMEFGDFGVALSNLPASGSIANVAASPSNILSKSTSARRYISNIRSTVHLADYVLDPVVSHHDGDDTDYIGFIADDLADQDARIGVFDIDGEIENYDVRAVAAILAAKINALEAKVTVLET